MQLHASLVLAAAALIAVWALVAALGGSVDSLGDTVLTDSRVEAVVPSVPLAVGTLFVLLTGLEYFVTGHFWLEFVELVSDAIPLFWGFRRRILFRQLDRRPSGLVGCCPTQKGSFPEHTTWPDR